jgi:hypothetical protein
MEQAAEVKGNFSLQHAIILAACSRPGFHEASVQRVDPQKRECG